MAIFHHESTVNNIMQEASADQYLVKYQPGLEENELETNIKNTLLKYLNEKATWEPNLKELDKYSAREGARVLVEKMNDIIEHG